MTNSLLVYLRYNKTAYSHYQESEAKPIRNLNAGRGLRLVDYEHRPNVTRVPVDWLCLTFLVDTELLLVPK
jgi:hypothetical protein